MNVSIEVSEELLKGANEVLEASYLDVPSAIGILLRRVVKEQSVAFLFANQNREPKNAKRNPANSDEEEFDMEDCDGDGFSLNDLFDVVDDLGVPHIEDQRAPRLPIDRGNMTKSRAVRLLWGKGHRIASNVTFASKNRGAYNYWANPEFLLLQSDWSLILNDWISKKLYLFTIPANSIQPSELTPRSDKEYIIDLQIMYRDPTFTDNRSGYSFAKFLTAEVDY